MDHTPNGEVGTTPMICATGALKTGPTRIGHIAGNITLPRTVALPTLIAVAVGALLGIMMALMVPVGGTQKWVLGPVLGGSAGWFLTTFSPLRDESLLTWLGLQLNTMRRQRLIDGKPVLVAVGSGVVGREVYGPVTIARSALRVSAGAWDDRGVPISAANGNTVTDGAAFSGPGAPVPSVDLDVPTQLQQSAGRRRAGTPASAHPATLQDVPAGHLPTEPGQPAPPLTTPLTTPLPGPASGPAGLAGPPPPRSRRSSQS